MPPNYNTIAFECATSNIAIPHANGDYACASFDMSQYYGDIVVQARMPACQKYLPKYHL